MSRFKLLIISVLTIFVVSGCSFLPRLTFDSPGMVPEVTSKGKSKVVCKGEVKRHPNGEIKSCTEGYYNYQEHYNQKERKMTIVEKFKSFINNLAGWGFWIFFGLLIFAPGVLGLIVGRLVEGTVGLTGKALKATVKGINNSKRSGRKVTEELSWEHSKNKKIKKKINKLRAELD